MIICKVIFKAIGYKYQKKVNNYIQLALQLVLIHGDLKDTASDWIDSSKRWLVDAGNFLLDAAKAGLDFLILDDVKTIFDPKASDVEKGFAILSIPCWKRSESRKKTYDLLKRYGDDVIDLANDVLKGRQKIGKYFVKSRIDEDKVILKETEKAMKSPIIQREANNLVEKYLRGLNPNKGAL